MIRTSLSTAGFVLLLATTSLAQKSGPTRTPYPRPLPIPNGPELALQYSTYFGGSTIDQISALVVGPDGYVYVAGTTKSKDFPVTPGAFQTHYGGDDGVGAGGDAFVAKFDPNTMALVYSTYVGGSLDESLIGMEVDAAGCAYILGITSSPDFPRTPGSYGTAGGNVFLTKLNPSGSALLYSATFGDATPTTLAVDSQGNAYVAGYTNSPNFPVTPGVVQSTLSDPQQPSQDGFVMKINSGGTGLVFSTYLGGGRDWGTAQAVSSFREIAIGPEGDVWVIGAGGGYGFPTTSDAMLDSCPFCSVIVRLNSTATALLYSSYVPGAELYALALDPSGSPYIAGQVTSEDVVLLPQVGEEFDPLYGVYYAKLTPEGSSFVYSRVLGPGEGAILSAAVDDAGKLYVAGSAGQPQPVLDGGLPSCNRDTLLNEYGVPQGGMFVAVMERSGVPLSSSYFGGCGINWLAAAPNSNDSHAVGVGRGGTIYLAGSTSSFDFPVTPGAFSCCDASSWPDTDPNAGFISSLGFTRNRGPRIKWIYDAASLTWGALAPGELIVIEGTDLGPPESVAGEFINGVMQNNVAGTTVLFDGVPAPLLSVSAARISAVVPFEATGRAVSHIQVNRPDGKSATWGEYIDQHLPSFFTADGSGEGQALAFNADGTPNSASNPAQRGSSVTLYMSGAGALDSPVVDGQLMTSVVPLTPFYAYVHIGDCNSTCFPLNIDFIGSVPGSIAGLTQLGFHLDIPDSFPTGIQDLVTLTMDDQVTQPNVYIAIK